MPCRLLHVIEQPDPEAYADPDLKDVVGDFPSFYCAESTPVRHLAANEAAHCLDRHEPCWRQSEEREGAS